MKNDFSTISFSDECRATLAELDGWIRAWVSYGNSKPRLLRRQQWRIWSNGWGQYYKQQNYISLKDNYCKFLNKTFFIF